jgi:hypothetical protein
MALGYESIGNTTALEAGKAQLTQFIIKKLSRSFLILLVPDVASTVHFIGCGSISYL